MKKQPNRSETKPEASALPTKAKGGDYNRRAARRAAGVAHDNGTPYGELDPTSLLAHAFEGGQDDPTVDLLEHAIDSIYMLKGTLELEDTAPREVVVSAPLVERYLYRIANMLEVASQLHQRQLAALEVTS